MKLLRKILHFYSSNNGANTSILNFQTRPSLTKSMMELDFSARLKDINCATLILCGKKDAANRKVAKELAENIQGEPQELARELKAFSVNFS